ncbi:neutral zinc metallopeptidase, partial [Rhizobium ruizarguesonis]
MEWRGRRQSDNIEDRRSDPTGGGFGRGGGFNCPSGGGVRRAGGGLSIGTIIFLVVI